MSQTPTPHNSLLAMHLGSEKAAEEARQEIRIRERRALLYNRASSLGGQSERRSNRLARLEAEVRRTRSELRHIRSELRRLKDTVSEIDEDLGIVEQRLESEGGHHGQAS